MSIPALPYRLHTFVLTASLTDLNTEVELKTNALSLHLASKMDVSNSGEQKKIITAAL